MASHRWFWMAVSEAQGVHAANEADALLGADVVSVEQQVERLEARLLARSSRGAAAARNLAAMLLDTSKPLQFLPEYGDDTPRLPLGSPDLFVRAMLMILRTFLLLAAAMLGVRCWREGVVMLSRPSSRLTLDMIMNAFLLIGIVAYFAWRFVNSKEHAQVVKQARLVARARSVSLAS
jgi:hypothetical protein